MIYEYVNLFIAIDQANIQHLLQVSREEPPTALKNSTDNKNYCNSISIHYRPATFYLASGKTNQNQSKLYQNIMSQRILRSQTSLQKGCSGKGIADDVTVSAHVDSEAWTKIFSNVGASFVAAELLQASSPGPYSQYCQTVLDIILSSSSKSTSGSFDLLVSYRSCYDEESHSSSLFLTVDDILF